MLGQPAGMKVDLENSEPQESRWVIGLHGKPPGPSTASQRALPDKQGISVQKPLFLFGFRWDLVSSQKPLPVHCVNSPLRHEWLYATTTSRSCGALPLAAGLGMSDHANRQNCDAERNLKFVEPWVDAELRVPAASAGSPATFG